MNGDQLKKKVETLSNSTEEFMAIESAKVGERKIQFNKMSERVI